MPKEHIQNKAIAHYAEYTFTTREAIQNTVFDTAAADSEILIPTTYWKDSILTTTEKSRWTFAHFGDTAEYHVTHWFSVWDIQITKIEGKSSTMTEQELMNFILETTEFPVSFYQDGNYTYGTIGN